LRYARTRLDADCEARAYRFFISEEIRIISDEIARAFGGGSGIQMNLNEYLEASTTGKAKADQKEKAKTKTEREILEYIKDGLHKLAEGSE
jgi:DNA-binding NarL/FixJ family response regulator